MTSRIRYGDLPSIVGDRFGPSPAVEVTQDMVDAFAECTLDAQWIHIDTARASATAWRTTIAPGFLTLALLSYFLGALLVVDDTEMAINYGLNRVRFPSIVPVGSRLYASAEVLDVSSAESFTSVTAKMTFNIEAQTKPCCVAESITRFVPRPGVMSS